MDDSSRDPTEKKAQEMAFAKAVQRRAQQPTASSRRAMALDRVDDQFNVGASVRHLQSIMNKVTEKEITADTVNAACNCVNNVNQTIKTVIAAARFLAEKD